MVTSDEEKFRQYSRELADAIDQRVEGWVSRVLRERLSSAGVQIDAAVETEVRQAAQRCRVDIARQLTELFSLDVDQQRTTPLAIIRSTVHHGTDVLSASAVPPVDRDDFDRGSFPDDIYALSPASMADVHESLVEPAIVWGAAKAHIHRTRHR